MSNIKNECNFSFLYDSSIEDLYETLCISKSKFKKLKKELSFKTKEKYSAHSLLNIPLDILNHDKVNPNYHGPLINILQEDEKFLILNKPSHIHTISNTYNGKNSIQNYLREYNNSLFKIEIPPSGISWGPLYRLDFLTTGLLIVCKKISDYKNLRANFSDLVKEKIYIANVSGIIKEDSKELLNILTPAGSMGHKIKVSLADKNNHNAHLTFQVLKRFEEKNMTTIKISLTQGIRHQIRAQLAYLGYPILNDPLYSNIDKNDVNMHLHCYLYQIETKSYHCPLPDYFPNITSI